MNCIRYLEKKHRLEKILSSQLLLDNAIFVPSNNTFFILEIKYQ